MHGARSLPLAIAVAAAGLAAPGSAQERPAAPDPTPESREHRSSARDGYVLSTGGEWLSSDVNFDELSESQLARRGDYLWFRRGGRAYLVEDAAALARAVALFEPLRALEPEQEALRERERALDRREDALDREEEDIDSAMERLEPADVDEGEGDEEGEYAAPPPAPPSEADERDRQELERRMDDLRDRQRALQAEQRAFERDERAFDQREEKLEAEAEAKLWRLMDELVASGAAKPAGAL
jgi:hypothetical protein